MGIADQDTDTNYGCADDEACLLPRVEALWEGAVRQWGWIRRLLATHRDDLTLGISLCRF